MLRLLQKAVVIFKGHCDKYSSHLCTLVGVCFLLLLLYRGDGKFFLSGIHMCTAARSHCSVIFVKTIADYALV